MSKLNLKFHNSTIWHNTKDCTSLQWLDDKNEIGIIINCRNDIKNGQVIVTETKSKYVDEIFESIISNGYEKISENLDEKGMIYEYLIEKYIVRCSFIRSGRLNVNSIIVFHK